MNGIDTSPLPEHLLALPNTRWAVWRWAGLRGAGFPAQQVLELATPEAAATADQLLQAEDNLTHTRDAALAVLQRELPVLAEDQRDVAKKFIRQITKGKLPTLPDWSFTGKTETEAFSQACTQLDHSRTDFKRAFEAGLERVSSLIYQAAGDDRFREAVTWQNRHALVTALHPLRRKPPGTTPRGSQRRQHEELVASYLQRYCAKNDTIGFFGPVGWAKFVSEGEAFAAHPGPALLAARNVYFEGWGLDALAETLGRNKALRPWLVPRRIPSIYLEGATLHLPQQKSLKFSAEQMAVLRACNGDRTAHEIAEQLLSAPVPKFKSPAEVLSVMEQLCSQGLMVWALEVPLETYPERTLKQRLEQIEDERLRTLGLRALGALEKARSNVARAAGDAAKLNQALEVMETTFTRLTNTAAIRAQGQTYAARTLVYEDCVRDLDVTIGPQVLETLAPPLALLLESARWFTFEAAALYRKVLTGIYRDLVEKTGSSIVPVVDVWQQAQPILFNNRPPLAESLLPAFQERWARVLSLPASQCRVAYASESLQSHIRTVFDAPRPGWRFARYQSPDLMIAASSVEAIRQGAYQLVMGELHIGTNTLRGSMFHYQHPDPAWALQAVERDLPEPLVMPILPKQWPGLTARTRPVFISPKDFRVAITYDACDVPGSQTVPIGALVLEERGGELLGRTRDGQLTFNIVELFADVIADQSINCFKILRFASHTPRITIDRLVVNRETWNFAAEALTFARQKDEADRFVALRRWVRTQGLPRFVFVKLSTERKPLYIDFASPVLVNILAKAIRRNLEADPAHTQISVTEMLPDLQHIWLPDAANQLYTSEIRITAVDLAV